jgi:hypothetical protein
MSTEAASDASPGSAHTHVTSQFSRRILDIGFLCAIVLATCSLIASVAYLFAFRGAADEAIKSFVEDFKKLQLAETGWASTSKTDEPESGAKTGDQGSSHAVPAPAAPRPTALPPELYPSATRPEQRAREEQIQILENCIRLEDHIRHRMETESATRPEPIDRAYKLLQDCILRRMATEMGGG